MFNLAWREIDLEKSQNIYLNRSNKKHKFYPLEKERDFNEYNVGREFSVGGNLLQGKSYSNESEALTAFNQLMHDTNKKAYHQNLSQEITDLIQETATDPPIRSKCLFSNLFEATDGKIYFATCYHQFGSGVNNEVMSNDPKFHIPGTILHLCIYDSVQKQFHRKIFVSNSLLQKIYEEPEIRDLEQQANLLNKANLDDEEKWLKEIAKTIFVEKMEINHFLEQQLTSFGLKYPKLIQGMEQFRNFLIKKAIEETHFQNIFNNLFYKLANLNELAPTIQTNQQNIVYSLYNRIIKEFHGELSKLELKDELRIEYQQYLQELIVQTTQPMVDHLIYNLQKHADTLSEETIVNPTNELAKTKSTEMTRLVENIQIKQKNFYPIKITRSPEDITNFFGEISTEIAAKEKDLGIPTNRWRPVLAIITTTLVSLSIVGLFYTIPKIKEALETASYCPLIFGKSTSARIAANTKHTMDEFNEDFKATIKSIG